MDIAIDISDIREAFEQLEAGERELAARRELEAGTLKRTQQNPEEATYEPKLDKETGRMDWTKTAREIDCLVRGATPWPGAFTTTADGAIKIFSVKPLHTGPSGAPGEIIAADA